MRAAQLRIDVDVDASGVGRGVGQAEGRLNKLGGVGRKAGLAVAAGTALAGAAAAKFGLDAVSAASDVEQAYGALESIYGKNADAVKKWSRGAAQEVGLATSEYANLAALLGAQLQGMGVETRKSANQSRELIALGSDLAATFGGSVADAVGAVSSLMKGERDPIERYGVSIKQADVNARLAALGLEGLTGKAAKQAEAQAVLSLLTEQTTAAQGAFGRESNTLAGQQERLTAQFENMKAAIGERLLPVALRLATWVNEKMLPGAKALARDLGARLGPAFNAVSGFITNRAVPAARAIFNWFVERIVPAIRSGVAPVLDGLRSAWGRVAASIDDNRPALQRILTAVRRVVEFVVDRVVPVIGTTLGAAFETAGSIISTVVGIFSRMSDAIGAVIGAVRDLIEWLGKIKLPNIPGLGRFLPGSATSSLSSAAANGTLVTSSSGRPVVIDARTYVQVDGALDDAPALARRLGAVLEGQAARLRGGSPLVGGLAS